MKVPRLVATCVTVALARSVRRVAARRRRSTRASPRELAWIAHAAERRHRPDLAASAATTRCPRSPPRASTPPTSRARRPPRTSTPGCGPPRPRRARRRSCSAMPPGSMSSGCRSRRTSSRRSPPSTTAAASSTARSATERRTSTRSRRWRSRASARRRACSRRPTATCAASSTSTAAGAFGRVGTDAQRATAGSVDMTGAVLAALCETGAAANDPDVRAGLSFLDGRQDPATAASETSTRPVGRCPASTPAGSLRRAGASPPRRACTPVDYLLSQQDPSGAFLFSGRAEPVLDAERRSSAGRRGLLGRPAAAGDGGRPALPRRAGRRRRHADAACAGDRRRRRGRAPCAA